MGRPTRGMREERASCCGCLQDQWRHSALLHGCYAQLQYNLSSPHSGSVQPVTHNIIQLQILNRTELINFIALNSIHTKWGRTNIHNVQQLQRAMTNDVHRRPQPQQPIPRQQQTSKHSSVEQNTHRKQPTLCKINCKGNRFPLVRHQGVLHAPMPCKNTIRALQL